MEKITAELLTSKNACSEQLAKFNELFPDGVAPTLELCVRHAKDFDWNWAANNLFTREQYEAFHTALVPVWHVYFKAERKNANNYEAAKRPLWDVWCAEEQRLWNDLNASLSDLNKRVQSSELPIAYETESKLLYKAFAEAKRPFWNAYVEAQKPFEDAYEAENNCIVGVLNVACATAFYNALVG